MVWFDGLKQQRTQPPWDSDTPIREEVFGLERLEQHGESLARAQTVCHTPKNVTSLHQRLADSEQVLLSAHSVIARAVAEGRSVTPAAEWLVNNSHVVEEQIRDIRKNLPPAFYEQLPKLADGPLAGHPRILGVAWAFIAHTDSRFDYKLLIAFVEAYQRVDPLQIGELWALPITLRIVLVENLRRAAKRIVASRDQRKSADQLIDSLAAEQDLVANQLNGISITDKNGALDAAFVVQLIHRLGEGLGDAHAARTWLTKELTRIGVSSDDVVRNEHQSISATNNTVRHIIRSMRIMPDVNWAGFFERVSLVDAVLKQTATYTQMDFSTRNSYRDAIERYGRRSRLSEIEIALQAVAMSGASPAGSKAREPGYFLLGGGCREFERKIGFKRQVRDILAAITQKGGLPGYAASIALLTVAVLVLPCLALAGQAVPVGWILGLAVVGLLPAVDLAIAIVNQAISHEIKPQIIPSFELLDGVPDDARTLVVIPTLLSGTDDVDAIVNRLEIHHLATQQQNVFYALLTDWTDSANERAASDDVLLQRAREHIARLNRLHLVSTDDGVRFFVFHRHRKWNGSENRWMGWERKRGKLHEVNKLLRGATDTSYVSASKSAIAYPDRIKFVVTLDSDTQLPRDAVRRLVGKMLHPLNAPEFSVHDQRVTGGYAVLQPRVTANLPVGNEASLFQRIYSQGAGIDPYAGAVSDVYQDLFGEGSFAGKGIYDVDAFEAATQGRFPENAVLSHDLLEGIYCRAGLATDVEVIEEFPSRYDVARGRDHRWVRGDWQLLPWIFSSRARFGMQQANVPALGRWKLADNLRRSLTPVATLASLALSWHLQLKPAAIWTAFIVFAVAIPTFLSIAANLTPSRANTTLQSHVEALVADAKLAIFQSALQITLLADRAFLMLDAILRTLFRLFMSRKNLLEWTTAAQGKSEAAATAAQYYSRMSGGVIVSMTVLIWVWLSGGGGLEIAIPISLLWMVAPAIARLVSFKRAAPQDEVLTHDNRLMLRIIARRTWFYFDEFVTDESNYLPPDNFQEQPRPVVAHRTSPTNIGLYLLSVVGAHDFGWISVYDAAERLEKTLRTAAQMARFNGHFFNWYDTRTLAVLEPQYVSTVDSGNLAGHLLAVASACREWAEDGKPNAAARDGLRDCVSLLRSGLLKSGDHPTIRQALESLDAEATPTNDTDNGSDQASGQIDWEAVRISALRIADHLSHDAAAPFSRKVAYAISKQAESHAQYAQLNAVELKALRRRLTAIADSAEYMALSMDFKFLVDQERELLSIGYSTVSEQLDDSCYDLLASEARLASFVAIAKGDLGSRHWFRLSRTLLPIEGTAALISWSGSMFEYLMPDLVTLTPRDSLLGSTARVAVGEQIRFGKKNGTPWGVSESAYNARDLEFTYQYSSFGIPELGLKRGLGENLVIAPYATALASLVLPNSAASNYARLERLGGCGAYGYYEAIDFTPSRVAHSERCEVIKAYMAHHQGMTIVALANTVLDSIIARRFHAAPIIQATELLLQERTPRLVPKPVQRATLMRAGPDEDELSLAAVRRVTARIGPTPDCQFLSHGRLSVMMTASGSGYTKWNGLAITRWMADATLDNLGSYVYLRDIQTGALWSAGEQPVGAAPASFEAAFSEDRVQLSRTDGSLKTVLDVVVSPEDPATCRRISVTNLGKKHRTIDVTSYEELVLAAAEADAAHPAFSKLFVVTEFDEQSGALIATRRRREPKEPEIHVATFAVSAVGTGAFEYETDRSKFIGRGRNLASPISIINGRPLESTTGAVIDPVFAIRQRVTIPPGVTIRIAFWTLAANNREALKPLIEKYKDAGAFARTSTLAWSHGLVELRHLGIEADDASLFQQIAGALAYSSRSLRAPEHVLQNGALGLGALWQSGISGDLPIVLVRISEIEDIGLVRQLLHAYEYWRSKGIEADLVVLNDHSASYQQELQNSLETLCQSVTSRHRLGRDNSKGSVYLLRSDLIEPRTLAALPAAARAAFHARRGSLADQIARLAKQPAGRLIPVRRAPLSEDPVARMDTSRLEFFNGYGGFQRDGREYVVIFDSGQSTPAPWVNVIANSRFGFQVSADGGGYTWSLNCRERQISPWSNDPVINRSGEVIYIRDDDTGELWSPTASPIRDHASPYIVAHGQGYTRFEHTSRGIELVLEQFVAGDDPVKISRLTVRNRSGKPRSLTVTSYVEWVLGQSRRTTSGQISTEYDERCSTIFSRNPWHNFFPGRVAFSTMTGGILGWTADRHDFIGPNGRLDNPAGLAGENILRSKSGTGLDPCAVLQTVLNLDARASAEVVVLLGDASSRAEAEQLAIKYSNANSADALAATVSSWDDFVSQMQIKTPDRALDILVNRWLPYQTLSCRLWGRGGLYQAGGAFGYRDQLQDVMSLAMTRPDLARAHLLKAAGRQFPEGDVQHWWLEPSGHGIRTRIADSCLWLAYVTTHYVKTTGDVALLNVDIPFIDGPVLKEHEHEAYFLPYDSDLTGSMYEHCARAIDRSIAKGSHGLALFGGGDWNDGMNRVGVEGRGESIWLSWFLISCLNGMLPHAEARGDANRAERWRAETESLRQALESNGWDGDWYRRGYFDDGTPLGSRDSEECQIDSVSQSWSVMSKAGQPDRTRTAMEAVRTRLIDRDTKLALLFSPPFDTAKPDPGYIKAYPPGLRENGGQYTHAAAWCIIALAGLGDGNAAGELLSLINPIRLSASRAGSRRYRLEPYVMAADIYSTGQNNGRGGWSWYTGAAGWTYRAALEHVLGITKEGDVLIISPCIPSDWQGFEVEYRYQGTLYRIVVTNPAQVSRGLLSATLNGAPLVVDSGNSAKVAMMQSGDVQEIKLTMGAMEARASAAE